jgi:hypothetical protein
MNGKTHLVLDIFYKTIRYYTIYFNDYDLPLLDYLMMMEHLLNQNGIYHYTYILVNGCEGIGTGYSHIFQHIIKRYYVFNKMIDDDDFQPLPMKPYFKGFNIKQPE